MASEESTQQGVDSQYYDKVLHIFRKLDLNGDGTVDRWELGETLQRSDAEYWTDARLDGLLESMNTKDDGAIHFGEMLAWLLDKPAHKLWKLFGDGAAGNGSVDMPEIAINSLEAPGYSPDKRDFSGISPQGRQEMKWELEKRDLAVKHLSLAPEGPPAAEAAPPGSPLAELRARSSERMAELERRALSDASQVANHVTALSAMRTAYDAKFEEIQRAYSRLEADNKELYLMMKSATQAIELLGSRCTRLEGEIRELRGPPFAGSRALQSSPELGTLFGLTQPQPSATQASSTAGSVQGTIPQVVRSLPARGSVVSTVASSIGRSEGQLELDCSASGTSKLDQLGQSTASSFTPGTYTSMKDEEEDNLENMRPEAFFKTFPKKSRHSMPPSIVRPTVDLSASRQSVESAVVQGAVQQGFVVPASRPLAPQPIAPQHFTPQQPAQGPLGQGSARVARSVVPAASGSVSTITSHAPSAMMTPLGGSGSAPIAVPYPTSAPGASLPVQIATAGIMQRTMLS